MKPINILIMGAAGRDFHVFNQCFRNNPLYNVVAFTHGQIIGVKNKRYPPELTGRAYPEGIPIYPEKELKRIILEKNVKKVFFAYSDISYVELMSKASLVQSTGSDFVLSSAESSMIKPDKRSISITGTRTGVGKSAVTRYIFKIIKSQRTTPVIIRHPMPYGDLRKTVVQKYTCLEDIEKYNCTIEEREEYEPHIRNHAVLFSGIDYTKILQKAQEDGEIIIWDGGNNDLPFYLTDINIVVADALRPEHIVEYYPSEINFRRADIIIINKVDIAKPTAVEKIYRYAAELNPNAAIIEGKLIKKAEPEPDIKNKKVIVIEDGPTVTHGGLSTGAAYTYAVEKGAKVVDPRSEIKGSLKEIFRVYPHIGPVLPAIGYNDEQKEDLLSTIRSIKFDYIISSTPADLNMLYKTEFNIIRVGYEFKQVRGEDLVNLISKI
ncbi:MAG: GTPase [Candidatus Odinarchaeia archaeon]